MPNWVEQDLHVVGDRRALDKFIRTGFRRRKRGELDDVLDFFALCPVKNKKAFTHPTGVVLIYFRTRAQANFSIITSWDYPAEFYASLAKYWPSLSFVCAVNEDMGQFGGIITIHDGQVRNLVRDYDTTYDRRAHRKAIGQALADWGRFLVDGRAWRLVAVGAYENGSMPFDAHFDGDFWFYFRTREELIRFRKRYKTRSIMRRAENEWKRTRAPSRSSESEHRSI